jgi:cardiolipin synthase
MLEANLSLLTVGNGVTLINTGEEKFGRLFEDLEGSRDHIYVEYYIVRDDDLGKKFLELLAKKAGEGSSVRLLVDGVGTHLPLEKVQDLRTTGVKVLQFFPPVVRSVPALNLRLNHRNHRKIVIVDGAIGYLGGYNVGDEYLGNQRLGRWRDTHLRIEGPAVLDLQTRSLLDWYLLSSCSLELSTRLFPSPPIPSTGGGSR